MPSANSPSGAPSDQTPMGADYYVSAISALTLQINQASQQGADGFLSAGSNFAAEQWYPPAGAGASRELEITGPQASLMAGGASLASSITQYVAPFATTTVGTNLRFYASGWGGNGYVTTFGVSSLAGGVGNFFTGAARVLDTINMLDGQMSTAHWVVNFSVGVLVLAVGGPEIAFVAGAYYLYDSFVPEKSNVFVNSITNLDAPGLAYGL
jgi:hypothetical protein